MLNIVHVNNYRDWSCINQNKYIFEDGRVTRMKHIKSFRNVLNLLRIASRTFIVNNPWLKSNPWPSALQLNYMIHCTTVPLRNKQTIKRVANVLSTHSQCIGTFFHCTGQCVFFQRVSLLLFIFAPLVYFLLCPFLSTQKPSLIDISNFLPTLYHWDKQFSFYTSVSLEIWLKF